ncbi:MAG: imidazole glycerol phosphate synthase subunit HisH [Clostridium sp.]|nr:imidazole glycerol phosphate synthase subunit HisH [Clostridium sp.]MCM1547107.1 imidazole glycerol phosphate synthase subunit HisH [Ruminococcus sp.]
MIAVIDYGAGNIFSVKNALDYIGMESVLTNSAEDIKNADALILPGVGAFPAAMKMLEKSGLIETIKTEAKKKPFLGICLGMQLLFEKGYEFEECGGLGLIGGSVRKMEEKDLIIPHMGWNRLEILNDCPLVSGLDENSFVYFVHSYKAECADENISAYSEYGGRVPALVFDGKTVYGAQFHPEKSGDTGLKILKNFGGLIR